MSHWVTWHEEYEDPASALSLRLRLVQEAVRRWFEAAGFAELSFESPPDPYVLCVGAHRLLGPPRPFDPDLRLFEFTGDGSRPA